MKFRLFLTVLLLGTFATAQVDIDTAPVGGAGLDTRFNSTAGSYNNRTGGGLVTASELSIPAKARKEFDKGLEAMRKPDLKQALQHLNKAVFIYPAFPGAYNNLGVVYARLGDTACEREALQKAIELNDHFALAYLNWARMSLASSDFADAEATLDKVTALDPTDPTALVLLAYTDVMQGHLRDAIRASERAHALGKPHAFAHRVAARAFEQQRQFDRAIAELETFLHEDPRGPLADSVSKELALIHGIPR